MLTCCAENALERAIFIVYCLSLPVIQSHVGSSKAATIELLYLSLYTIEKCVILDQVIRVGPTLI